MSNKEPGDDYDEPDWCDEQRDPIRPWHVGHFVHQSPESIHSSVATTDSSRYRSMRNKDDRLSTFTDRWPPTANIVPEKLTEAGFHFVGPGDKVKCNECNKVLKKWTKDDDPFSEHLRVSHNCPFLKRRAAIEATTYTRSPSDDLAFNSIDTPSARLEFEQSESASREWVEQFRLMQAVEANSTTDAVVSEDILSLKITVANDINDSDKVPNRMKPLYPRYAAFGKRVATYSEWPRGVQIGMSPLVHAGFYYTGEKDRVQCFHCGCVMDDWKLTDDPFTKHSKYNPSCGFIRAAIHKELNSI